MLCLTCPCHHRNVRLSTSWQDYLDTTTDCRNYVQFFPHPGIRDTGISPVQRLFCMLGEYDKGKHRSL